MKRSLIHGALLAALVLGSIWTLGRQAGKAGLFSDEGMCGCWAQEILRGGPAAPFRPEHPYFLELFGRSLPLAASFYRGPWEYYTAVPFVWAFDRVEALRVHALFWAVLGVCAVYWLAFLLTRSPLISALCGASLATSQPYADLVKKGVVIGGTPQPALCAASLCLLILAARGSRRAWAFSCVLAGLAAGFEPQGLAFLLSWCVCAVWFRRELRAGAGSAGRAPLSRSLPLLLVGALPILAADLLNFRYSASQFLESVLVTPWGIRNAEYVKNLSARFAQLFWLLSSRIDWRSPPGRVLDLFWPALMGAGVALAASTWAWRRWTGLSIEKPLFFPLIVMTIVLFMSPFTLYTSSPRHLLIILPMALIAAAVLPGLAPLRLAGVARGVLAALLLCGIGVNAARLRRYWSENERNGSVAGNPSAGLLTVGAWLAERDPRHVYVFSWEDVGALCLSTFGRADVFRYETRAAAVNNDGLSLAGFLERSGLPDEGGYFVLEAGDPARAGTLAGLEAFSREHGERFSHVRDFQRRDGSTEFEAYRVTRNRRRRPVIGV